MNKIHTTQFGQFLTEARQGAELTQKGLAARILVTESAVSEWERGLAYPEFATLGPLARALGVTEGELVRASEDHRGRSDAQQARGHRRWRAALLWATLSAYVVALVASFVVNLSVEHTLSWFWIVASAVGLAFSLTTLPLLLRARRGWSTLTASALSLGLLLASIEYVGGGSFFGIVAASVLFAGLVIWGPLAIRDFAPAAIRRHGAIISVVAGSVGLAALLWIILSTMGRADAFFSLAVPIAVWGVAVAVLLTLVVRYLPLRGLYRAAIASVLGAAVALTTEPYVEMVVDARPFTFASVDLTIWGDATINGNVNALVAMGFIFAAVVLLVLSFRPAAR
ncbi:helix-turn-helix domain-containing protein [Microbacterium caowuchunii]|uniref:helix-turn-helix domain-containing protein n=1 Tax=Microbacterium caowuchunii TaxID=2614638 RepID=UPI001786E0A2|nr:helix-turn-helix transcriptional regulator [Microbacterium caowuchunii]